MSAWIEALVRTPLSEALGWALFHSLWQGAIAAAALAAFRTARARYWAGCVALAAILCCFAGTWWILLPADGAGWITRELPVEPRVPAAAWASPPKSIQQAGDLLAWLTPFWIAGVVLCQIRTGAGWAAARRLRRCGVCQPPAAWRNRLEELAARMRVCRPVQLLESSLAEVPMVIGHLRPVILVPAGLLSFMPSEQVEWILLHELAHIRRRDYLVNLLQTIAEGLLFYHPAVWWISGVIRSEREHCCDDMAVEASSSGGAYEYAVALTALAQSRWGHQETAAGMAATGGKLMTRIHRLLYPRRTATAWTGSSLLVLAVAAAVAWQGVAAPQNPREKADPYVRWVNEDVVYIVDAREREAFLKLTTTEEREKFVEQFWLRRDPTPGTAKNERKEEHYRRIGYAMERFGAKSKAGWQTDRGRIYILYGPPDEIEAHPSGRAGGPPFMKWLYRRLEGIGDRVIVEFVDASKDGDYRQTTDPSQRK